MKKYLLITTLFTLAIPGNTQASDSLKGFLAGTVVTGVLGIFAAEMYAGIRAKQRENEVLHRIRQAIPGQENCQQTPFAVSLKGFRMEERYIIGKIKDEPSGLEFAFERNSEQDSQDKQ